MAHRSVVRKSILLRTCLRVRDKFLDLILISYLSSLKRESMNALHDPPIML